MLKKALVCLSLAWATLGSVAQAQDISQKEKNSEPIAVEQKLPELKNRATFKSTFAKVDKKNQDEINSRLELLSKVGNVEMTVLLVDSVKPLTIEQYSIELAEKWKVGKAKEDNGLIFIIAAQDRKARLEVGYGLEGVITDAMASRIINDYVIPRLKVAQWDMGIYEAIGRVHNLTRGASVDDEVMVMFGGSGVPKVPPKNYNSSSASSSSVSLISPNDIADAGGEVLVVMLVVALVVSLFTTGIGKMILIGLLVGGILHYIARGLGQAISAILGAVASGVLGYFLLDNFIVSLLAGGLFGAFGVFWLFELLQVVASIAGSVKGGSSGSGGYSGGGGRFGGGGSTGSW